MKTLIVEDDLTSRILLEEILKPYSSTQIAINGKEAVAAVRTALDQREPFDLICLDIMMPEMDGQTALRHIRELERAEESLSVGGVKIIIITALDSINNICNAYSGLCDDYLAKPIDIEKLLGELRKLALIK